MAQLVATGFHRSAGILKLYIFFIFCFPILFYTLKKKKMTTTVWNIQRQRSDSQSQYQQHNQKQTQPVSEAFEYRLECDVDRFSELLYVYLLLLKRYCTTQPVI